ncbi:protein of unknown function [Maridesulfovibrio hydrothermalis AM13 = DSM 14728]|uniref:Uncharacterized protein n=1 Tax=Maridesulfovibrio hydrothermalis AM13 = DSM 14728 TaxID=1121451 RepID=L0R9X5_9BACT|nr:protein of unknown function [Maridesulfovibrio hydrothermalis AM13 = DSM 14728]
MASKLNIFATGVRKYTLFPILSKPNIRIAESYGTKRIAKITRIFSFNS